MQHSDHNATDAIADKYSRSDSGGSNTIIELPPDFPPESFWLSKDSEFDWFDRNAFLTRNESTKSYYVNPTHSNSSTQRYSSHTLKSKHVIGLPDARKTCYVDSKRKPANVCLFKAIEKPLETLNVTEPTSPKVSCIGRVRSKRSRGIRKSFKHEPEKSTSQRSGSSRVKKPAFVSRIKSLFRSDRPRCVKNGEPEQKVNEPVVRTGSRRIRVSVKPFESEPVTPSEPMGLGGMIRFTSGRRLESCGGDENGDVARPHSSNLGLGGV